MPDMLVKLYENYESRELKNDLDQKGITIRNALPPEKEIIVNWVREKFGTHWSSEVSVAFSKTPVACLIATKENDLVGFACYDVTCKSFFGPTGVCENQRGSGIGKALLLESLNELKNLGYAYAVIGGAGPVDFYKKVCGAIEIPDSVPGIYKGMLK